MISGRSKSKVTPTVIRAGEVYGKAEFLRRTGLADRSLREARKKGLKTVFVHRRLFICGSDWLDYLASQAAEQSAAPRQPR